MGALPRVAVVRRRPRVASTTTLRRRSWRALAGLAAGLAAANASRGQLAAIGRPLRMLETMTPEAYRRGDVNLDFHSAIARASGNPVLEQVILDLLGRFHETGFTDLPGPEDWTGLQADHQPVYDAIAAGDPGAAKNAMAAHFESLRRGLEDNDR